MAKDTTSGGAEVRVYAPEDRAALRELFARVGEGSPTASLWGHTESEAAVYLYPYMDLEPGSLFLAVADGALVGYLTGCPDGSRFPGEEERMKRAFGRYRPFLRPGPAAFFARAAVDTMRDAVRRRPVAGDFTDPRWPAHLHINVAAPARGTGAAHALMDRWLTRLRESGSPGCHLQTLVENTRAVRFFERAGFEAHGPDLPVAGLRYQGGRVGQRTMVWSP